MLILLKQQILKKKKRQIPLIVIVCFYTYQRGLLGKSQIDVCHIKLALLEKEKMS